MRDVNEDTETRTYAILTTSGPDTLPYQLVYVTQAESERHALELLAEDSMSGDRSVEAGWEWAIYEIPAEMAEDDQAIYDYVADQPPVRLETPTA